MQEQSPYPGQFTHAACYTGNEGDSLGLGFFPLKSYFTTAHVWATRVGDDLTIVFPNIDGGAQPDLLHQRDAALAYVVPRAQRSIQWPHPWCAR